MMPELPEVETVMRGLEPHLAGRRISRVQLNRKDLRVPFPRGFAKALEGAEVERLQRRAKYMLWHLSTGMAVIVHLGMSGKFTIYEEGMAGVANPHDHVVITTDAGTRLVYTDHRRFGLMSLVKQPDIETHPYFRGMGPEPLGNEFSGPVLTERLRGKKTPIKAALLDQRVVAGLGNIYVCEALWRARISPRRMAASVAGKRAERLVPAIKDVLGEAIASGGSTLRDYARTDGELGYFQHRFDVYDREGALCRSCNTGEIRRLVQSGRSTYFCPVCQR
jgi:formamidopyrimidine-DNA glycosylase